MVIYVQRPEIESIPEDSFSGGDTECSIQNIVAEVKFLNIGNNLGYFVVFKAATGGLKVRFKSIDIRGISINLLGRKTIEVTKFGKGMFLMAERLKWCTFEQVSILSSR